jgi:hypothetical protein
MILRTLRAASWDRTQSTRISDRNHNLSRLLTAYFYPGEASRSFARRKMSRKPALKDITVSMAAECAACGATLLTSPRPAATSNLEQAAQELEHLFAKHLEQKHSDQTALAG